MGQETTTAILSCPHAALYLYIALTQLSTRITVPCYYLHVHILYIHIALASNSIVHSVKVKLKMLKVTQNYQYVVFHFKLSVINRISVCLSADLLVCKILTNYSTCSGCVCVWQAFLFRASIFTKFSRKVYCFCALSEKQDDRHDHFSILPID